MELVEGLQLLGLSEKEARIYKALLSHGQAKAGAISDETQIHRRSVYDALDSLSRKGLATKAVKDGAQVFSPTALESFNYLIKEKEMILAELLPLLRKEREQESGEPLVTVYGGKAGLKIIHEDILREDADYLIYGGSAQVVELLKPFYQLWTKRRVQKNLPIRGMWIDTPVVRERLGTIPLLDAKFIPKEYFSNVVWWVYADKLVLVFFRAEPIAVSIEGEDFARSYRNFFRIMWKVAKR